MKIDRPKVEARPSGGKWSEAAFMFDKTKLLADEWAAKGVQVNAIAPGYRATNNRVALQADGVRNDEGWLAR